MVDKSQEADTRQTTLETAAAGVAYQLRTGVTGKQRDEYFSDDPLLTPREAAAERRQAISTFWRDVKRGLLPPAIYVSPRCPRWRRSEIRDALEAQRAPTKTAA